MSGLRASAPRSRGDRPTGPWRPAALTVHGVYKRLQEVWVTDGRSGDRVRRKQPRFDVRFRVDGADFRIAFGQKGWADDFARRLREGYARGWLFDPDVRRFVEPPDTTEKPARDALTFFDHARDYVKRKWPAWEPATRRNGQRDLARACLHLLRDGAPALDAAAREGADGYLRQVALMVPALATPDPEQERWAGWFARWSLPLAEVTDRHLHAFMTHVRTYAPDGTPRPLAPSSANRTRAVVRGAFLNARKRRLIDWDPWEGVEAERLLDHDRVDPDLVMSPDDVRALAQACGAIDWRYEAFVLVQGLCGLRPGEATELRRRDFRTRDGRLATVTARGTHSSVPGRFLDDGESRSRPLKGRGRRAGRTVPLPRELVEPMERHLHDLVAPRQDAVVFTNRVGGRLTLSTFHRDVWSKARAAVFTPDSPLRRVRRHDLRHAAITAWLNAGVPLKTAQAWSGHRTVSVLLDTYLGVIRGDEDLALARYETLLAGGPG